jgi:hypothetical protein
MLMTIMADIGVAGLLGGLAVSRFDFSLVDFID